MITEACKTGMLHLSKSFVYYPDHHANFHFEEKNVAGAGKAYFSSNAPCVVMRATNQAPLLWALNNRKCAEGAFVTFDADGCRLHIVEMKSKLTQGTWAKVLLQFNGMYLSALATARILGIESFTSVTCYIAYTEDAMNPDKSADMILIKPFVGVPNPVGGATEWEKERCLLPLNQAATIRKTQRDANNDANFGLV
ncbi:MULTISPECIES: hypothetical protein [Rhizobium]|uniref:Uncharacterized protein n=1 Tax=Rhizobium paranaense TaxID=1650438 RepID=A0A7W9D4T3_9HYPH|nr:MULTISPECIES: hypothetical protein [Rhizobium]MBB5577713.1 hypothetical protein [Rhizobium paranaense]